MTTPVVLPKPNPPRPQQNQVEEEEKVQERPPKSNVPSLDLLTDE